SPPARWPAPRRPPPPCSAAAPGGCSGADPHPAGRRRPAPSGRPGAGHRCRCPPGPAPTRCPRWNAVNGRTRSSRAHLSTTGSPTAAPARRVSEPLDHEHALLAVQPGEDDRGGVLALQGELLAQLVRYDGGASLLDLHSPHVPLAQVGTQPLQAEV